MPDSAADLPAGLVARPQTRLADEVAHVLRDLILRGQLAPGTPLLQIQLAERLGVSRTPLREAFRTLERDGLLRISNGNKTVEVIELDGRHLIDTYQIREVIDGLAARLAAKRTLPEDAVQQLERCINRMETASGPKLDAAEYGEAHADFHLSVLDASGNSRMREFAPLVRLSSHMLLTRFLQQHLEGDVEETLRRVICLGNDNHRGIFTAIRSGDAVAAEEAATRHIRKTMRFISSISVDGAPANRQPA
ncbi:FCD domain-containing protein [Actinomadura sp. LD22]|uniref:FCD domain-containing protein n=1 Tax=Actinomadura physcomitrii TaxID=2650748 RepID=A0A6I4M699_9ACTN|nr:GntR family transcriptional regulator [Actinomadura physcomitrii]MVZ99854.1 FCD domain-containing protein [Actinomadura physcomitrii]